MKTDCTLYLQCSQYSILYSIGGIKLPFDSSLYGRSPLPGTVYYNQFTCPNNAVSVIQCNPQFVGGQCELEFVVQCTGMFYFNVVKLSISMITDQQISQSVV